MNENKKNLKLPGTYSGPIQIALGGAGVAIFGGFCASFGLAAAIFGSASSLLSTSLLFFVALFITFAGISGFFLAKGILTRNRVLRFADYFARWRGKSFIMLEDLAQQSGRSLKQVRQDVRYLLERNLLPGARLDPEETCLLLTQESIDQYEAARKSMQIREEEEQRRQQQLEQMEQADEPEREMYTFMSQCEAILKELDQYQVRIFSPVLGQKLSLFELRLTRIFVCVKEHPEKLRLTRRLMDYYVPSVLNFLSVYDDLEKQPVQGENIQKTREEIESSMDDVNEALENMFDELFQSEALDVSADIQVLKTMLTRDGWIRPYVRSDTTST